ncbi:RrF2 family transcriptional regulator [Paradesulfitobacterium ferrireducens]|uniref:RrF2 family transcriptional regulator n=1 Tax=Paradesulfitobacterium ferrireducens TaxID=2816476 RepID=UPI001A8F69E2|nr:Rrf2 family transcriptional regulator [Paradesulfitobacterium ferrireducens]
MKINQATDYAFRTVLFLAKQWDSHLVMAQDIAKSEVIPMRYLLKIMPSLIKAGIVTSVRGVGGGYALAKDPRDITLLDILEAVEGPIELNRCLIRPDLCSKNGSATCEIHAALAQIQNRLRRDFQSYAVADLI